MPRYFCIPHYARAIVLLHQATSMASLLLVLSLIVLSISSSFSLPSSTILDAAEILSNSGFETMALNLELASQTLNPLTRSLTIFAPSDFAFKKMGHLPLSLLQYHLLPHAFSLQSLSSLPFGAKIATLLPGHSLFVTKSHFNDWISINNVTVSGSPIFDDGTLVIFGIEKFLDPYFQIPTTTPGRNSILRCIPMRKNDRTWFSEENSFQEASEILRSKGCSLIASLLDMQFLVLKDRPQLTLFAPVDEVMVNHIGNLSNYSSILRYHLVPCKILWGDLVSLEDGTVLRTYQREFIINVTKSADDKLLLNGVPVIFPELYDSDWLVVHGLQKVLSVSKGREQEAEDSGHAQGAIEPKKSSFAFGGHYTVEEYPTSHSHFSVFH